MSPEKSDKKELTRYLLGEMSEAEQMQLEAHYFADPQMFAELCSWRNHLIDSYMAGEVSPSLRERFEAGIEKSWAMNERIRFAETLQDAVEKRGTPAPRGTGESLRVFITSYRRHLVEAAFLLMTLLAAWIILRLFF